MHPDIIGHKALQLGKLRSFALPLVTMGDTYEVRQTKYPQGSFHSLTH